nr:hypothetical protein 1DG000109 [Iridovirus CN01]
MSSNLYHIFSFFQFKFIGSFRNKFKNKLYRVKTKYTFFKMGEIIVEKVANENFENYFPEHKKFIPMPILYLELLENKLKVKPQLLNKSYKPRPAPVSKSSGSQFDLRREIKNTTRESSRVQESTQRESSIRESSRVREESSQKEDASEFVGYYERRDERRERREEEKPEEEDKSHEEISQEDKSHEEPREDPQEDKPREEKSHEPVEDDDEYSDPIQNKLNLLFGEDEDVSATSRHHQPPSFDELRQKKVVDVADYPKFIENETEETVKERNALFFKYEVLKRMHPNANIPECNFYSDPKIMAKKYDMLTKTLSLDSSVNHWKRIMIAFLMMSEIVLGKMNFDMEGFAQQQIMSMNTYDQLLLEMAEKSYTPMGSSKWPTEIRLIMVLTMNVVIFIVSKMIMKNTGTNLLGSINNITNLFTEQQGEKSMKEP